MKNSEVTYLSGELDGSEGDDLSWLDDTSLHSAHGHCADTADFVNILGN